ncbi:DUF4817 domain-containing protein [Nephila pilipes]|uniref:DUF4817 domain-containing protein n=1 Tax=Nephila pilipes TaxID=299642 RepID=A0A8X6NLE1_NEPPI|nr:DUF4817 domain-containing protein [Nephila pilipes]
MAISFPERALVMKLFYENQGNIVSIFHAFRLRKKLLHGPMSPQGMRDMISRFEENGPLCGQYSKRRKSISARVISAVATDVDEKSLTNDHGVSNTPG